MLRLNASGLCLVAVSFLSAQEVPNVNDDSLRVDLFAAEPLIQTPIGMTFDKAGRLLVIESQTHFRPKDWQGPAHDQIVWLKDTDGDGRADAREVIFDQTDATMDMATHPDGSVYLSTRNEILRLCDQDNDGKYEKIDRRIVWLETEGRYPHNGLTGLAFDAKGNLYFGMGENLGAAYTIQGTDGASFSDQGEGGNVWHCTAEGKKLKRVATGFWNPFGVCVDPWGNVFATDNDPDSSPPCRLHHIVEGGDYGYQFRYGRSGLHPFISWNGELPGTLPMLAGTGESPCDVICYAPTAGAGNRALGEKWQGTLLVASWVDHRIESYKLTPKDGSFASKMTLLVEGGQDFRPVAFATAPDGSLYVSDWVKHDYELHGEGRVWRISAKQASEQPVSALKPDAANAEAELREGILSGPTPSDEEVAQWLKLTKPYLVSAVIWRMAREGEQLRGFAAQTLGDVGMDATVLLAARAALKREGVELSPLATQMIGRGLAHSDPKMQLLALKWISDERLAPFRPLVEARLKDHALTAPVYYAVLTTLARLESAETNEAALVNRLMEDIASPSVPPQHKMLALEILPDRDKHLKAADMAPLMIKAAPSYKTWLVNYLGTLRDVKRFEPLYQIAFDSNENALVRAAALMHVEVKGADVPALIDLLVSEETKEELKKAALQSLQGVTLSGEQKASVAKLNQAALIAMQARVLGKAFTPSTRPDFKNILVWKNYLEQVPGDLDLANGQRVFMSPKLGACAVCHRAEGIGGIAGPNLKTISKQMDSTYLIESLLQPNRNVAPHFEAFMLTTKDGRSATAFRLLERGGTHTYVDIVGNQFEVKIEDIVSRVPLPMSIMPEGLVSKLTDAEVRDLVAYLRSIKE